MCKNTKNTRSRSCWFAQCTDFLLIFLLCVSTPAMAEDFGPVKEYTEDGSDSESHRLNDDGTTITVVPDHEYTLGGVISGSGNLIKAGGGVLTLGSRFNTYTGGTIVTGGILNVMNWTNANADSLANAVSGSGSELNITNNSRIGYANNGVLNVTDGAKVTTSSSTYLGYSSGSTGTVTVSGDGAELNAGGLLYVGFGGDGVLNVADGAKVTTGGTTYLGSSSGSTGTVTVSGNSELDMGSTLYVGSYGNGALNISDSAKVTLTSLNSIIYLGYGSGSTGTVTVSDNSELDAGSSLYVGRSGEGLLNITDGAKVTADYSYLGSGSGSGGTITVSGNSELDVENALYIGQSGGGTLNITDGAKVTAGYSSLGSNSGSSGTITVSGNSELDVQGELYVGQSGDGALDITDGAKVTAGSSSIGLLTGSSGTITVSGADSELNAGSSLSVGAFGDGALNITNGAKVTADSSSLGLNPGSSGTITVSGTDSELDVQGELSVGNNGAGSLNIMDGGTATATSISVNPQGSVTVSGTGTLGGGTYTGAITNNGVLTFNQSVSQALSGSISGEGSLIKTGDGTLTLSGDNTFSGQTTVSGGVLELGNVLVSSSGLTLYSGTTFRTNNHACDLNGKTLSVWDSATYEGDLDAQGAVLSFFSGEGPVTGSILNVIGNADVSSSAVNLNVFGNTPLAVGDTVSLLKTTGDLSAAAVALDDSSSSIRAGSTLVYDISLITLPDELQATIESGRATEQAKALSEGMLSAMALTLQGADLAAGQGMNAAVQAARKAAARGGRFNPAGFASASGGSVRYNSGSHIDMNSVSALAGISFGMDLAPESPAPESLASESPAPGYSAGHLTLGAFFEFGNGSYDTHNSFGNAPSVNGEGSTRYMGGGIMARMDFKETGPGHAYTEASARAGRVHNDYTGSDLRDGFGRKAEYESSSSYYSLHLGTGYVWEITEKAALDLHAKYFWTRQEGDSVSLSTGESLRFKNADSHRARLGARFDYVVNEYVTPYAGAAFEHEFDGKVRAAVNGFTLNTPDLKGNTGIGELGLALTPSQTLPLSFDLGVQGYTGKREGVTGSLQARLEF